MATSHANDVALSSIGYHPYLICSTNPNLSGSERDDAVYELFQNTPNVSASHYYTEGNLFMNTNEISCGVVRAFDDTIHKVYLNNPLSSLYMYVNPLHASMKMVQNTVEVLESWFDGTNAGDVVSINEMAEEDEGEGSSNRITVRAMGIRLVLCPGVQDFNGQDVDDDEDGRRPSLSTGPSIKKKQRIDTSSWDENKPKPSLIANIGGDTTPIHDFSKKLGMSKTSLDGSILFPTDNTITPWSPPDRPMDFIDGCLQVELPDFDPSTTGLSQGNNTIAIKFHAPEESQRFSINIAAPNNDNYNDILFHFNPRHFQRGGQLVINDRKESMWGNDISVPLSTLPLMFGVQSCTLIVQINEEGFDVFVEGVHCARLEHRTLLPKGKGPLFLQFPSSDDYGNPENWLVYRVWWGRKQSMAQDLNDVAGVNIYTSVHPKKLFISGLSKVHTDPEVDLRRAELERAFRKYGGPSGVVAVSVQKNSTFAFVEVASEQQADLALLEMTNSGRYRVNKARRTKHEALLEERAAKEAKEKGTTKESVDWD